MRFQILLLVLLSALQAFTLRGLSAGEIPSRPILRPTRTVGDIFDPSPTGRFLQGKKKVPYCPKLRAPYVVSIRDVNGAHSCGGILIEKDVVLTSAACIDHRIKTGMPARPIVHVGGYNSDDPYQKRVAVNVTLHNKWNGDLLNGHDLALVKLDRPTCVLPVKYIGKQDPKQKTFLVFGYGRTQDKGKYSSNSLYGNSVEFESKEFCASGNSTDNGDGLTCVHITVGGSGLCAGDAGSPIVYAPPSPVYEDNLIAIFSYSIGECTDGKSYAVTTPVRPFKKWILKTIRSDGFKGKTKRSRKKLQA